MKKSIAIVLLALGAIAPAPGYANSWQHDTGVKASDPQLSGPRNTAYNYVIQPGVGIGPVYLGGSVSDAIQHLGEPDRVNRNTFRGPGYSADEVTYYYTGDCIDFTWTDSGVVPKIENGFRGINVTCDKWTTVNGLHVGSSMAEVVARLGPYCAKTEDDGSLVVATKEGIWFWADNRNSPVNSISVVPSSTSWNGMCKD